MDEKLNINEHIKIDLILDEQKEVPINNKEKWLIISDLHIGKNNDKANDCLLTDEKI